MKKLFLLVLLIEASAAFADDLSAIITNAAPGSDNGAIDLLLSGGNAPYTFQWTGPDGYNSTDEDLAALKPGEYCVTVSDFYCGTAALCVLVEEDVATGIINQGNLSLTVFPNPFSKEFNLVVKGFQPGQYLFELHDVNGNVIWNDTRSLMTGTNTHHFILDDQLAAGRYEMTIRNNKESILSRSVVRIR